MRVRDDGSTARITFNSPECALQGSLHYIRQLVQMKNSLTDTFVYSGFPDFRIFNGPGAAPRIFLVRGARTERARVFLFLCFAPLWSMRFSSDVAGDHRLELSACKRV